MDIFSLLFINLIPLYILIALGFAAGRWFEVDRQTLGSLGIYIFMPIVAFGFVAKLDFQPVYTSLPIIVFVLFSVMNFLWLWIGQKIYPDKRANLLSLCAAAGNTGYFGLPLILLLFDESWVAVYIFMLLGNLVYEATVMYYVAARGQLNVRQSLVKLMKFPTLYAIAAGLLVNAANIELPELFDTYWSYTKGAYVIVGMMIIGAALSRVDKLVVAPRFITPVFLAQFLMMPLIVYGMIELDRNLLHIFAPEVHKLLFVMAIVPPAANIAAFAVQLDLNPEKAATTILIGTILALFYIPLVLALSGLF